MADDNGLYVDIEAGFITKIEAITLSDETVFDPTGVDHWKGQIKSLRDFQTAYPFAYVRCSRARSGSREASDLKQLITVDIEFGTYIAGSNARIGIGTDASDEELGYSRLRDLLITALDRQFVATTKSNIEEPEYKDDKILIDVSESGQAPYYCCSGLMTFEVIALGV